MLHLRKIRFEIWLHRGFQYVGTEYKTAQERVYETDIGYRVETLGNILFRLDCEKYYPCRNVNCIRQGLTERKYK